MKKEKDIGLQYMIGLGLRPAKTGHQFFSMLQEKFGKDNAEAVARFMNERYDAQNRGEGSDDSAFYKLKNSTADMSVFISGSYDGDFIRKTCNYISSKADKLRDCKHILEVGCDCGIFSCFLGRTFPASQIVAIDRCEDAITVAKELANRLGISNVTFFHADIHDFAAGKYDAIFSIRVMHENRLLGDKEDHTLLIDTQAEKFAAATAGYAEDLSNKLKDNGLLLSIERCGLNPLLYGWMQVLNEHGIVTKDYAQLCCQELGNEAFFQALDMKKDGTRFQKEDIWNQFTTCFFGVNKELTQTDFSGWEASVVLQALHGELLDGVFAYKNGEKVAKVAVWKSVGGDTDILVEKHIVGQRNNLFVRDMAMLDEIIQQIANDKELMKKEWGATIKPFKVVDGKEIEIE